MLLGTGLVKKSSPTKVGPRTAGRSAVGAGLVENPLFCLGSPPVLGAGLVKKSSPTKVGPRTAGRSAIGAGLVEKPLFCLGAPPVLGSGLVKKSSPTKVGPSTEGRSAGGAGLVDFFTNNGRSDGVSAGEVKNVVLLKPKPVCLFDWVNRGFTSKPKPVL